MSPESRSNSRKTDLNLNEKVDEELKKKTPESGKKTGKEDRISITPRIKKQKRQGTRQLMVPLNLPNIFPKKWA